MGHKYLLENQVRAVVTKWMGFYTGTVLNNGKDLMLHAQHNTKQIKFGFLCGRTLNRISQLVILLIRKCIVNVYTAPCLQDLPITDFVA